MAPSTNAPIIPAPVPDAPEARLISTFFANLFKNTDFSMSFLDPDFSMRILPGSLRVPEMKRAEYVGFLKEGLLSAYKTIEVTPTGWTVDREETESEGVKGRRVVVEARSHGVSNIDGEVFGQEYFFLFIVSNGKIKRIHEYVDSFYMARWTAQQEKAKAAKAKL